jgi:hypothetical protein
MPTKEDKTGESCGARKKENAETLTHPIVRT